MAMTEGGRRLRATASRLGAHQTRRVLAAAAARGLGLGVLVLAVTLVLDRFPGLPAFLRAAGLAAAVLTPLVLFGRALFRRLPALRDAEAAARETESQTAELRERLVPALQVLDSRDDQHTGYSTELVDAFVDETADVVDRVRPAELPYNESFRHGVVTAGVGAAAALIAVVLLGPAGAGGGLARLFGSFADLGPRPPVTFEVVSGDVAVPRGQPAALRARITHARMEDGAAAAVLQWRAEPEDEWTDVPLRGAPDAPATDARGREIPVARLDYEMTEVRESFRYRFGHDGDFSDEFGVTAVPHPSLAIDEVRYTYPEYTGLPVRTVRDGAGDLAALKGSTAELLVRSTNEARTAAIELESGATVPLETTGDGRLVGRLPIAGEDTYRLRVEDTLGLVNQNPLTYRIRALADEAPFIRLLEPGQDRDLDESMNVTLRFSAVDDFGLGPVKLVWELSRRDGEQSAVIHRPEGIVTEMNEPWDWDLADADLLPGDTVVYHLEVTDNNGIDGPSTARTRDYVLRFPTLGEIFAEIDEEGAEGIEELREVADEARRVEEQIEQLSREILKQGESSWENRKEMERALESQEALAEKLEQAREDIESQLQKLAESEFATLDAVEKMQQIQKLLDEVATQEMKEALEKLRRALEEANPRQMQEDLAEFDQSQEEMMQQLDRVIENLKQFRLEERMKAAVRQLEELAARQERVNDELQRAEPQDAPERELAQADPQEEPQDGEPQDGEQQDGEQQDGEPQDGEPQDGEPQDGDPQDGEQQDGEPQDGEPQDGEPQDGDPQDGEQQDGEPQDGDPQDGEQQDGEPQDGEQKDGQPQDRQREMERLAREEKALAEEARRLEEEIKELAKMTQELRDPQSQKGMNEMSERMEAGEIPETMDDMAQEMSEGEEQQAQERGEEALTKLRDLLREMSSMQMQMAQRMMQINQAAINRAVRDLLSVSTDEEGLTRALSEIPRDTNSATRLFADEQHLLIQGTTRVDEMLDEVSKDTPLMSGDIGKNLRESIRSMKGAAYGLENGAVHLAREDGARAVEQVNSVVIALLLAAESMSGSCSSGMPMSSFMQQLQQMSGDQQKLNEALRKMMEQGGKSMDQRLQAQLNDMAQEQQRIREQLQQLLEESGGSQNLLGRLDSVTEKLSEVEKRLRDGQLDEDTLREQEWALTRLLDSQRSLRERDLGRERESRTGEELADLLPPGALPEGLEEETRDLREDLLKALDRRYPPKYEELIRRYFRSLTDEAPPAELP